MVRTAIGLYEVAGTSHMSAHAAGPPRIAGDRAAERLSDGHAGGRGAAQPAALDLGRHTAAARRACRTARPRLGPCGRATRHDRCCRDEHGNAVGGVRSPWVDVPVASYYPHSTPRDRRRGYGRTERRRLAPEDVADLMGCMSRFTPDKLRALYGTPARYRELFAAQLERSIDQRWIAAADRERARDVAATHRVLMAEGSATPVPLHFQLMPDTGACGKPRVMPHSHRP